MRKTLLHTKGAHHRFDPKNILYIIGEQNYCYLHLLNGKAILMSHTLKRYEQQWPNFIRVHKHALVNPEYATQLDLAPRLRLPSYLVMQNQARLNISRRRLAIVCQQLTTIHQPTLMTY